LAPTLQCDKTRAQKDEHNTRVSQPTEIEQAVAALRRGALIALPTETVYGLGADAENELAVRRIFAAKGRPSSHPLIVHIADVAAARTWSSGLGALGEHLAAAFWPGPLTLIAQRSARASDAVTGGQPTVGLRVPNHPLALAVLRAFDGGVAAPSANRFGRVSPTTAQHVRDELGGEVDVVLDGGPCAVGVESTIVDVSGDAPRLLRPGGISLEALEATLRRPVLQAAHATDIRAPGMLESHYAPRAGVRLVSEAELVEWSKGDVVVIAKAGVVVPPGVTRLTVPDDDAGFAQVLYARLREADLLAGQILVVPPAESGLGRAVADRLRRAAAPRARKPDGAF
jgi:L-threonylcarbamoyladenylate synthase